MEDLSSRLNGSGIRYIAVEGNIGAGKTTVARLLAEETGSRLFLEEVDDNPFIEKFYGDMGGYAFQAQIFFLLNRYRQQTEIAQQDLFTDLMVADYLFAKDRIYAHAVLGDDELAPLQQDAFPARGQDRQAGPGRLSPGGSRGPAAEDTARGAGPTKRV